MVDEDFNCVECMYVILVSIRSMLSHIIVFRGSLHVFQKVLEFND